MENNENNENKIIIPEDQLVFVPLGGATGIGMNFFAYGYHGKWLVVDCGIGFPGENLPGVDCLLPNPQFLAERKADIVGLVITHAHEDHIGAVGYLWHDLQCPIYCTAFANELVETKLDEMGLLGRADTHVVKQGDVIDLNPFEVEFIRMNHSLPEPNALAIRTKEGLVVHTGDWRLDKDPILDQEPDFKTLEALGKEGVLALVSDSTNASGETQKGTEADVRTTLIKLVGEYPNVHIAVGCFASNVARMESIYEAAKENGRDVCLLGRSLWRIDAAARATGYFKDVPEFLSEEEALERPRGSVLFICTGSQGEPYSALNNLCATTPNKNTVYFGADDVVIFSSRVIPGNEKAIALLQKRLASKGIKIITDREALVHVSGHYAGDDLKKMYEMLKPKISLPVHGEALELVYHSNVAKKCGVPYVYCLEDGEAIVLSGESPEILGEVPAGILAVDGKQIVPLNAEVIKKRRKMMDDGSAVLTLVINKDGKVLGEPQLSTFGLLASDSADQGELLERITHAMDEVDRSRLDDDNLIKDTMRHTIRQFLNEKYGKKPLMDIHLIRV
ncbi:MAG: ribonuclease J [Alphaproteobacteria bacterium]|nr:ribonuclease J [Alphaproteobacteria bacterium]